MSQETKILKVKKDSPVNKVAGALAEMIREGHAVEIHAIGAASVNQAAKAAATARGYVGANGLNLTFTPAFITVEIEGETRTGMKFIVNY